MSKPESQLREPRLLPPPLEKGRGTCPLEPPRYLYQLPRDAHLHQGQRGRSPPAPWPALSTWVSYFSPPPPSSLGLSPAPRPTAGTPSTGMGAAGCPCQASDRLSGGSRGVGGVRSSDSKGLGSRLPLCRSSSLACLEGRGSNSSAKGKQARFRGSLWEGREGSSGTRGTPESEGPPRRRRPQEGRHQSSGAVVSAASSGVGLPGFDPSPAAPRLGDVGRVA